MSNSNKIDNNTVKDDNCEFRDHVGFDSQEESLYSAQVYKVLKARDHSNPSWGQIRRSKELQQLWEPSYRKEFDGLVDDKSLIRVSREEALSHGLLPLHIWGS